MPCLNQVKTMFLKWFKWLGSWEIREILTDSMQLASKKREGRNERFIIDQLKELFFFYGQVIT